jgi:hypothetical protein
MSVGGGRNGPMITSEVIDSARFQPDLGGVDDVKLDGPR